MVESILNHNNNFVNNQQYEEFRTSKFPNKKLAIVTCMDTRLSELLPAALGIKNGDAKIIKNAGGVISHPFGSAVRSLLIAVYELGVTDIMVIGHTDCGVQHMDSEKMLCAMKRRGITEQNLDIVKYFGVDTAKWLAGFEDVDNAVESSVKLLTNHPLLSKDINLYGYVMDSVTGQLSFVSSRIDGVISEVAPQ